jgi:DNA-binding LytR/AlgR family response regulator
MVSELFSKVPRRLGYDVLMVRSEDHYLRVHTSKGDALVLYRLSDAIEELDDLGYRGLRVHRSYWVRLEAVEGSETDGRKTSLRLRGGLAVPVSRTYREVVRSAGLLD